MTHMLNNVNSDFRGPFQSVSLFICQYEIDHAMKPNHFNLSEGLRKEMRRKREEGRLTESKAADMIDKKSPMEGMTLSSAVPLSVSTLDSLSEDESHKPDAQDNGDPCSPADKAVAVGVAGVAEEAVEDELGRYVRVDSSNDNGRDEHKEERALACPRLRQRTDARGSCVLTHVVVADSGDDGEQDHLEDGERRQSFRDCTD